MWTIAEVIQARGEVQNKVYLTPLWHEMACRLGSRGSAGKGLHVTGKAVIPPRTIKAIRLRYPRQV